MSDASEGDRPRRRRRQPQPTPPPQGSAMRGIVLVVAAVVVGLLLLQDDGASTAQINVGADDDPAQSTDQTTTSAPTTTQAVRAPSEVKVLVANGSGVNGAAGTQTDALEALGYVTANPTNAERVTATVVYYDTGYEAEAEALATELGSDPSAVAPLPTPAPVDDMQLSNLLVVVGPDIAGAG